HPGQTVLPVSAAVLLGAVPAAGAQGEPVARRGAGPEPAVPQRSDGDVVGGVVVYVEAVRGESVPGRQRAAHTIRGDPGRGRQHPQLLGVHRRGGVHPPAGHTAEGGGQQERARWTVYRQPGRAGRPAAGVVRRGLCPGFVPVDQPRRSSFKMALWRSSSLEVISANSLSTTDGRSVGHAFLNSRRVACVSSRVVSGPRRSRGRGPARKTAAAGPSSSAASAANPRPASPTAGSRSVVSSPG